MDNSKSKVIILGSVALGALLIVGMGVLMFGKDPTATPRPAQVTGDGKPAEASLPDVKSGPAQKPADNAAAGAKPAAPAATPSAAKLGVQAPREVDLEPKAGEPVQPAPTSSGLTAQEQWNNERNGYTIQFQEKLNELEYRRVLVANGMPIERARHEALITLYKDSITNMQSGEATNLAAEVKRVQEEEKQIMRGARDSQLHP